MKKKIHEAVRSLSRARQIALAGSIVGMLATIMPWYAIGSTTLENIHSYNGFQDQNMIVGLISFTFLLAVFLLIMLPLIGLRLPRFPWSESGMLIFFGGESALLVFVITVMHATSITRAVNYNLRIGIHMTLIAAILILIAGYLLRQEETSSTRVRTDPLVRPSRQSYHHLPSHEINLRERGGDEATGEEVKKDDLRMKLDI